MKKHDNFSEWYNDVIEQAELSDKRYPVKGMNVWMPYGWKAMTLIDKHIRREFDAANHQEVCFPLLISEEEFQKEADHIKGFNTEVYWVTHAGDNELDVKLLLRPTSETAMYPIFKLWVRSHADLPLKTYQIVNTFRYETKQTRSFMRVREIHFFESHTCHADFEDAERQVREDIEIMGRFSEKLCIPYKLLKRTEWDKFPGAFYTIGIDTLLCTGKTIQLGSIHQYKDNFSRPYEITYEDESGEHKYVHQTTYGMAERLLGAVVAIHGDDSGLVFPPDIAPYQVVIVPIFTKETREEVVQECKKVEKALGDSGIRVHFDTRDLRPGNKYYHWEFKGVPLRIELGKRDIDSGIVTTARRDTGEKGQVKRDEVVPDIKNILSAISENLMARAQKEMDSGTAEVSSLEEAKEKKTLLRMGWCGGDSCGHQIEDVTEKDILGTPVPPEEFKGKCIVCGKETDTPVYVAKAH